MRIDWVKFPTVAILGGSEMDIIEIDIDGLTVFSAEEQQGIWDQLDAIQIGWAWPLEFK